MPYAQHLAYSLYKTKVISMSENKNSGWILIGLSLLMAATRFNHFGSLSTLPDASLAISFLEDCICAICHGLYSCLSKPH